MPTRFPIAAFPYIALPLVAFAALLLGACAGHPAPPANVSADNTLVMHKGALCGCCDGWRDHLRENGFAVQSHSYAMGLDEVKDQWGVPAGMRSCHTGIVKNKYVFEGHVPARYIRRYLDNPPPGTIGLAAPGMPAGSPGMHRGGEFKPYDLYLLLEGGDYRFYTRVTEPG